MKTKMICLLLMLSISALITPQKTSAQPGAVSFQVFYDQLSPYGTWIENPQYGYVWIPNAEPEFTPYATNGHWVYTDYGWTWVSDYTWGWAPFHYGRWFYDPIYGHIWAPDYEWGPGWVVWRQSNDYYGWAPMGPGIDYETAYGNNYYVPANQYTFVKSENFGRTDVYNYYVTNTNNTTIYNNTTVINNTVVNNTNSVKYSAGPDKGKVETHIGKTITPVTIKEVGKPNQNLTPTKLKIYKPEVQKPSNYSTNYTPKGNNEGNNTVKGNNTTGINNGTVKGTTTGYTTKDNNEGNNTVKGNNTGNNNGTVKSTTTTGYTTKDNNEGNNTVKGNNTGTNNGTYKGSTTGTTTINKPAPSKVYDLKDVKTLQQRKTEYQQQNPKSNQVKGNNQKEIKPQQNPPKKGEGDKSKK